VATEVVDLDPFPGDRLNCRDRAVRPNQEGLPTMDRFVRFGYVLLAFAPLPACAPRADQMTVYVPGFADPWLAGMPNGSTASGYPTTPNLPNPDVAPTHSPVLVTGALITPGASLMFTATGAVAYGPAPPAGPDTKRSGPDGRMYNGLYIHHLVGAQNGLSDIVAPINGLLGVFLDNSAPNGTAAPRSLDFRALASLGVTSPGTLDAGQLDRVGGGVGYSTLRPALKQVFFIGDGLDAVAAQQLVVVPFGATRLYLGTADGGNWADNRGTPNDPDVPGFHVRITSSGDPLPPGFSTPEPGTLTLLAVGAVGLCGYALRRRQQRKGGDRVAVAPSARATKRSGGRTPGLCASMLLRVRGGADRPGAGEEDTASHSGGCGFQASAGLGGLLPLDVSQRQEHLLDGRGVLVAIPKGGAEDEGGLPGRAGAQQRSVVMAVVGASCRPRRARVR
jgi:hypothetical protein